MTYEFPSANRGTAHEFIQERKYLKNVTSKTLAWYEQSFKTFDGCQTEQQYKQRIVELRNRGVSSISVNTWLRCINAFLHWRDGRGEKCGPACIHLHLPRLKEEQKILATLPADAIAKITQCRARGRNLIRAHLAALTILDTGLRAAELLGLTKEDVDLDNLVVKVLGKGGKHRLVPFSPELRKHLFRLVVKRDARGKVVAGKYIFGTKNETKVSVSNLERDFKVLGKHLAITGVRFSPHTLRHTFACEYLKRGGNLEFLRRILGHTSLVTTQKYLKSLGVEDLCLVHGDLSPLSARR